MIKKKKVLILGGIKQMMGIVEAAKRMGLYAIVTDNRYGASVKQCADKSYDFSPSDTSSLAKVVSEEGIEGVFTAIDDVNVWNALKLCKTVGLPMFASQEQMDMAAAKNKFLEFCSIFNVPVFQEQTLRQNARTDLHSASSKRNLLFLAQLAAKDGKRRIDHLQTEKLYYTIHNKNFCRMQRPHLFIKSSAINPRRTSNIFSSDENKAIANQFLQ